MAIQILMPALSPTMTEGNLVKWHKKVGDKIKSGDLIAEIETDKATMEVEAVDEGVLGKILVPEGTEEVKVNTVIGMILEEGENADSIAIPSAVEIEVKSIKTPMVQEECSVELAAPTASPVCANDSSRVVATPLAKRIASQEGVDLKGRSGTGPNGRIVKSDVESWKGSGSSSAPSFAKSTISKGDESIDAEGLPPYELVKHSNMRKVIAKRLTASKQTVPHFYLEVACDVDNLLDLRIKINNGLKDHKVSINDCIIKATAVALKKVPAVNVSWTDEGLRQFNRADIAVAVATPGGLITPIIRNADEKGLTMISKEIKDLAERARGSGLKPEEFTGGTFSISNLGMFGIERFQAIINPPQAAIMAVGASVPRAYFDDEQDSWANKSVINVSLSIDHRAIDGAVGAEFLKTFKEIIENPLVMLI